MDGWTLRQTQLEQIRKDLTHAWRSHRPLVHGLEKLTGGRSGCTWLARTPSGHRVVWKIIFVSSTRPPSGTLSSTQAEWAMQNRLQRWIRRQVWVNGLCCFGVWRWTRQELTNYWCLDGAFTAAEWAELSQRPHTRLLCWCWEWAAGGSVSDWVHRFARGESQLVPSWAPTTRRLWWQSMLWQLFFAVAQLQQREPGFRHFDLHWGNVVLQPMAQPTWFQYHWPGTSQGVVVPIFWLVQILDFDLVHCTARPHAKTQSRRAQKKFGIGVDASPAYDTHLFCTALDRLRVLRPDLFDKATLAFLDAAVPEGVRRGQDGCCVTRPGQDFRLSLDAQIKMPSPELFLDHAYFQWDQPWPEPIPTLWLSLE